MNFRNLLVFPFIFIGFSALAQNPGDTIFVQSLDYNSTTRDTMVSFPTNQNLTYEKILMQYNMRCKGARTSTGANRNLGCGEWDYSCNTYITDSSKVDSILSYHPSHIISGFSGTSYSYTQNTVYDFQRFIQPKVVGNVIVSETQNTIGSGTLMLDKTIATDQNSSKSQYLYTAVELSAAGLLAGNIDGLLLNAQNTGSAGFMRVRIKHSNATKLTSSSVDKTGFTTVYFQSTSFTSGSNRFQFHNAFNWDGISNLLVEFSHTNSTASSALNLNGSSTTDTLGLTASNNYHVNTTSGPSFTVPSSNLSSINNEITVSFWSKGNTGAASTSTTVIEGVNSANLRELNVHLPWGNSQVYFDCGNDGSNYDRINKSAPTSIVENSWNHWAFTKNATSGSMKIYLNGTLWHSGTGKNRPITLDSLNFGSSLGRTTKYPGNVDELRIWDKELSQSEIQTWMNRPVNSSHPSYSNLLAYFELDEGANSLVQNSLNGVNSNFLGTPQWSYVRGLELDRFFTEHTNRPNLSLLQGTYNFSVGNDTILDSIASIPNLVTEYQIVNQSGSLNDDVISTVTANNYWEASYSYTFDGVTGLKLDSTAIASMGIINISQLPYHRRVPTKFEIMSFVTPYGINLNLGAEGKTWTFDLTDFSTILKGDKRMTMERGGQWQEEMDIQFLFIVGTPPRDVMDIQQIWKVESRGYAGILDNRFFESRDVILNPNAQHFKLRSSITGHGQEGEFIPRTHFINLNGGANEFEWQVWKECGENPVYPQGGTWIYDRAGWCPGMATDVQEFDIDAFGAAGQSVAIDYGLLSASGTSNYIVNNQLVSYGAINHSLDAAVVEISGPTNRVEYARFNALCRSPKVIIKNTGSAKLTSLTIEYWVNDDPNRQVFNWTGDLDFSDQEEVELPSNYDLWAAISTTENIFNVEVKSPNQGVDEYAFNNKYSTDFSIPEVMPGELVFWFRTNNFPLENKVELFDDSGSRIFLREQMSANTQYRDTFNLAVGCYSLVISDSDDDGINFWANNDGNGSAFFRKVQGGIVKTINPDFGGSAVFNFTVDSPLSYDELHLRDQLHIYPNPAQDEFVVEGEDMKGIKVEMYNALGQKIGVHLVVSENEIRVDASHLARGIYTINLLRGEQVQSHKIVLD